MKRILSLIIVMLALCSIAFAAGSQKSIEDSGNVRVQAAVEGFQKAMIQAKNQSRAEHVEQVMEKVQEKSRERLNELKGLTVEEQCGEECEIIATGRKDAKLFGLLKMPKIYRYEVQEDGEVKLKKRLYEYLWKFED